MLSKASKERIPWQFLAVIWIVVLLVGLGGFLFYSSQKKKIISEKQNELTAIATLKIKDIEEWRMEHIRDGEILSSIIPRNKLILDFFANGNSSDPGMELKQRMMIFMKDYDYFGALLTDTAGIIRLIYTASDTGFMINASPLRGIDPLTISLSDLHFSDDLHSRISIDLSGGVPCS